MRLESPATWRVPGPFFCFAFVLSLAAQGARRGAASQLPVYISHRLRVMYPRFFDFNIAAVNCPKVEG
jgi:hypothetical protein